MKDWYVIWSPRYGYYVEGSGSIPKFNTSPEKATRFHLDGAKRTIDLINEFHKNLNLQPLLIIEETMETNQSDLQPYQESDAVAYCKKHYPEMCENFLRLQAEQFELLCKKQMDYGPSNIAMGTQLKTQNEKRVSLTGLIVRMNDKMQRLVNLVLINQRDPQNESLEDTFNDLAVYSNIALTVMDDKWGK